jgi:hypothetical protein
LPEPIDQQVDRDAAPHGRIERVEKLDGVRVVFDVVGRQVQKRSRLADHRKAARPLVGAVP